MYVSVFLFHLPVRKIRNLFIIKMSEPAANEIKSTEAPKQFGAPPYPKEYLMQLGGVRWVSGSVPLHPCKRADLCAGSECRFAKYPADLCWDFAKRGGCGRRQCRSLHVVPDHDNVLYVFVAKHIKPNQTLSRSDLIRLVGQKHEALEITRKRERDVSEIHATQKAAENLVHKEVLKGALLREAVQPERLKGMSTDQICSLLK